MSPHWRRIGKVFDPADHALPDGAVSHASAPQVLDCGSFARVYFSTRAPGPGGKPISRIAFADMSRDLRRVLRVSTKSVLPPGGLGDYDEHGAFPMGVIRRGSQVHGYVCGWSRRVSVPVETAVGLAVSRDGGESFERRGDGPLLSASRLEPCLVGDAFVREISGTLRMWYIFGVGWKRFAPGAPPERVYKIGQAVCEDGINWTREEGRAIVTDRLGPDECQAMPSVVSFSGRHHLFFCYRHATGFRDDPTRGYRIGHAWSDDLHGWTRDDSLGLAPSADGWDCAMTCYPHAFELDGRVLMLYNGAEFGRGGFGLAELVP